MKLNAGAVVKTDSKAIIKFTGLMGQNFVAIDFGSPDAPQAVDGAVLATVEQPDLNAIMAKLDDAADGIQNLAKSFTGDKINNLLGPLDDFVKQNSGHLSGTISNIENISGQIASGQGTVGKLIYTDTLYNSALDTVTNLQDTVAAARAGRQRGQRRPGHHRQAGDGRHALQRHHRLDDQPQPDFAEDQPGTRHHRQAGQRPGILQERQAHAAKAGQGRRQSGRPGAVERPRHHGEQFGVVTVVYRSRRGDEAYLESSWQTARVNVGIANSGF